MQVDGQMNGYPCQGLELPQVQELLSLWRWLHHLPGLVTNQKLSKTQLSSTWRLCHGDTVGYSPSLQPAAGARLSIPTFHCDLVFLMNSPIWEPTKNHLVRTEALLSLKKCQGIRALCREPGSKTTCRNRRCIWRPLCSGNGQGGELCARTPG